MGTVSMETYIRPDLGLMPNDNVAPSSDKTRIMRILIAGSGGMIGSAVAPYLAPVGDA